MTKVSTEFQNDLQGCNPESMKERVPATTRAKDKAIELGQDAAQAIDSKREPAANAMESAASTLHQTAEKLPPKVAKVSNLAHRAASNLENTAEYVRRNDTRAMARDVRDFVTNHPGPALALAVAFGFLFGRALRRD